MQHKTSPVSGPQVWATNFVGDFRVSNQRPRKFNIAVLLWRLFVAGPEKAGRHFTKGGVGGSVGFGARPGVARLAKSRHFWTLWLSYILAGFRGQNPRAARICGFLRGSSWRGLFRLRARLRKKRLVHGCGGRGGRASQPKQQSRTGRKRIGDMETLIRRASSEGLEVLDRLISQIRLKATSSFWGSERCTAGLEPSGDRYKNELRRDLEKDKLYG